MPRVATTLALAAGLLLLAAGFAVPAGAHMPDRVLTSSPASAQRATASADWTSYPVPGGYSVKVASAYYPETEIQEVVGVLGSLVHGKEMNSLSVYVATPDEMAAMCGTGFMGCYSPSAERIVVSGSDESAAGIPRQHVIAHEYGHHIANRQLNGPWWPALNAGTKRWATYERVCEEARQQRLYPGDQGAHYWENPGEAFAESYANMNFPALGLAWNYTPLLQPDPVSLQKIRADVTRPWTGRRTTKWRRMFGRHGGRVVRSVATPLDGRLSVSLKSPRGSDYDLYLRTADGGRGRVLERDSAGRSTKRVSARVCGERAVRIEVRRRSGTGPFTVKIARP
ncbi:MAG: hypothetical protein AABM29_03445 [Actinomycetota bacterium]